jgi:hypothetical protein
MATLAALAGFAVAMIAEADREARSLRSPSLTSVASLPGSQRRMCHVAPPTER